MGEAVRFMVEARTVLLLGVLGCVSILLACGSSIAWYKADRARREAEATKLEWAAARDSMKVLLAGNWKKLGPWDRVYYGRAPGDTLKRAPR